ncbi:TRAP transporter small permease [Mycobacterium sp. NPDC003449]
MPESPGSTETVDAGVVPTPRTTPSPRLAKLDRSLDVVSTTIARVCAWTVAAMLLLMLAAVTLQVASRYWLHFLVGGSEELARLSMVTMVFLGLPVLARYSEHIKLDVANEFIRNVRAREWLARAALLMELVFLVVLSALAYEFVVSLWHSQQQSPALGLRILWSRLPILIGSSLAALVCACILVRRVTGNPDEDKVPGNLTVPGT